MNADESFAAFIARVQSGEPADLEDLCRAHPDQQAELRRRYADWVRAGKALERLDLLNLNEPTKDPLTPSAGPRLLAPTPEVYADRYTLHGEIGRGGMGSILSVRDESLGRELAMKVLRGQGALFAGMPEPPTPPHDLARFLEEARITGVLQHPNIVPVHELGADPEGKPYFTMKLVEGRTFREVMPLAREQREGWSLQRALGVLQKVCEAVGYAHDKGVLHRDLKPSNLMLGSFGEVYVMDWGLARDMTRPESTRPPTTAAPVDGEQDDFRTRDGEILGTPEYMSPEQAAGKREDIGPSSDVFAVGAMLYELLTGQGPNSNRQHGAAHVRIAAAIGAAPQEVRHLAPDTPAELCAICERAIARRPEDRYPSMVELGEDLRAYLEGRVVKAYATGAWAEFRKWIQRNPLVASLAGSLIALVTLGLVVISTLAVHISEQKSDLEQQRSLLATRNEELQAVTEFQASVLNEIDVAAMGIGVLSSLREELRASLVLEDVSPQQIEAQLAEFDARVARINPTDLALEVLDDHVLSTTTRTIEAEFVDQPRVEASLRASSGNTFRELGLYPQALPQLQRSLELRRVELGDEHPETLRAANQLGSLLREMGRFDEAETPLREAREGSRRHLGADHASSLQYLGDLGLLLKSTNRFEEAEPLYREAAERSRRAFGDRAPGTLGAIENLGLLLQAKNELEESEALLREALEGNRQVLGPNDPRLFTSVNNLGFFLKNQQRFEEAEPFYQEALAGRRRLLGNGHPETLTSINNYGLLLKLKGDLQGAEPLYREALVMRRQKLGDNHPNTFVSLNNMGSLLKSLEKYEEAEPHYREALAGCRRKFGTTHPRTLVYANNLGSLLRTMERPEEAIPYLEMAVSGARQELGLEHPNTPFFMFNLGMTLAQAGEDDPAEALLREALEVVRQQAPEGHRLEPSLLEALSQFED